MPKKCTPSIKQVPVSAAEFAAAQARHLDSFTYDNALLDVDGAAQAEQWGLLVRTARNALERGVDAFTRSRGLANITYLNRFGIFARAAGRRGRHLAQRAWVLDLANPDTPEEALAYAQACKDFVNHALGIHPPEYCLGYSAPENHAAYGALLQQAEALARHLHLDSPFPVTRLPRYIAGVTDPTGSQSDHNRSATAGTTPSADAAQPSGDER
jgi:hypothetical protein